MSDTIASSQELARSNSQSATTTPQPQSSAQAPAPAPAAPQPQPLIRQWIALEKGSCDLRFGEAALEQAPHIVKTQAGLPMRLALVVENTCSKDMVKELQQGFTSAGFRVALITLDSQIPYTLASVEELCRSFLKHHITSGDMVCALASRTILGVVAAACRMWCGQTPACAIPLDLSALVEACGMPRAFSLDDTSAMLSLSSQFDLVIADTKLFNFDLSSLESRECRALMVAAACAESDQAFKKLFDASFDIMDGSTFSFCEQLLEAIKLRGRMISSSAFSVRQASSYGVALSRAFAHSFTEDLEAPLLLSEALRFSARLSCAQGQLPVDDVLCQDELLDRLGLESPCVDVDPQQLFDSIKAECFLRSNKQMLPLPQAIGRVRMMCVEDALLLEHAQAYAQARKSWA